ncbi:hypothetical protein L1O03_07805 [Corynebacterium uropygiale]|uniref:Uncharacterized protein n=1 Tax=Corynebacterium uropygiale TaxID=1775911 RepID=A0A9X1QQ39_9CORY|nr:hypothetical protein [Corynebacterium uropygiale]MCF4007076.1 hypothetical protein [Corynebacterium uropygiale]
MHFLGFPPYASAMDAIVAVVFGLMAGAVPLILGFIVAFFLLRHDDQDRVRRHLSSPPGRRSLGLGWVAGLSVVGAVLVWFIWLSWTSVANTAAAVGANYPYNVPQVIGCVVFMVLLVLLIGWRARHRMAGPMLSAACAVLGFLLPWTYMAAGAEGPNFYLVGASMLATGGMLGLGIVAFIQGMVRRSRALQATGAQKDPSEVS